MVDLPELSNPTIINLDSFEEKEPITLFYFSIFLFFILFYLLVYQYNI